LTEAVHLTKHHGLGNDFLIALEEIDGPLDGSAALARALCDRHRGIGADGFIIGARPSSGATTPDGRAVDVVMRLWNADGSRAEMSGNGIRCLGQAFAMAQRDTTGTYVVATDGGIRELVVDDDTTTGLAAVSVSMGRVSDGPEIPQSVADRLAGTVHATLDVGNPHLVIVVPHLDEIDLVGEGSWLESQFADGVNVEFITATSDHALDLLVWERGAGVTAACGTGATAASVLAHRWGLVGRDVRVTMPGGAADVLVGEGADEPVLSGPSQYIAAIEVADVR
jgi:diaminopimelate epimerase